MSSIKEKNTVALTTASAAAVLYIVWYTEGVIACKSSWRRQFLTHISVALNTG